MGLELMPWQRQVVEVATEYDPATGIPHYRELMVSTPRQSGKSTLILALLLDRCLAWGSPQACVWTGQDGTSIRKKWLQELVPQLERSELAPMIRQVRRANGSEGVEWHTGSRIELLPSSETAGHGMVIDLAVLDEIFADTDNRREAALLPAMATRAEAQMLVCSTAGTGASTVFNRKVRAGRNAVAEDLDNGLAYFEWSAPDGWDPADEESWWTFMPALGHTITPAVIRQARQTLEEEPGEFVRAFGNRPMLDGSDVFPDVIWQRCVSYSAEPSGDLVIAVDVSPDRDTAAIAVAGGGVVELVDYRGGTPSWVVARAAELSDRYGAPVRFDGRGPAAGLEGIGELKRGQPMKSSEVLDACAAFFDAVADEHIEIRQDDALDAASRGCVKKSVGDMYCWSRKASRRDVTPLYAATLALFGPDSKPSTPPAAMYVGFS
jgi:phage terminase large subunit-like protein